MCETESNVEAQLRQLGFGYRARFLQQSAHLIMSSHGPKWLHTLRNTPYLQARGALLTLPGVGPKVALHLIANANTRTMQICWLRWQNAKKNCNQVLITVDPLKSLAAVC